MLAHESGDPMLAARFSCLTQIKEDAWGAVDAVAGDEGRSDQAKQSGVLVRVVRERLLKPLVIAARRHAEHATHGLDTELLAMSPDEIIGRTDTPHTWRSHVIDATLSATIWAVLITWG